PGATARVTDGHLEIHDPPNTLGFVGLRLAKEIDPALDLYWLPRGVFQRPRGEVLEWTASVKRENELAVLLETRTVRIEVDPYGLHLTYLMLDLGLDGADVDAPQLAAGERARFRLERTDAHPLQRLYVDGKVAWERPKTPGEWEFARFGATRSGDE